MEEAKSRRNFVYLGPFDIEDWRFVGRIELHRRPASNVKAAFERETSVL